MPSWNWDEATAREGWVDQSTSNTDHNDLTKGKQGYDYATFSEITPNPVACWPLHEDSGTTINDVAGSNDGTYNGLTLGQNGLLGTTAPSADGVDDYGTLGSGIYDGTAATFSVWACATGLDSTFQYIFDIRDGGIVRIGTTDTNDWRILFQGTGGNQEFTATAAENEWTFLTATYDGTTGEAFVDASSIGSGTVDLASDTEGLSIASPSGSLGSFVFDGRIADPRYYDINLTNDQIQTLFDVVDTPGDWLGTGKVI
jgi:hypothetical protein